MERRLTTILAADVVGYSGLMEANEARTLAALKEHREQLIDPLIAKHDGRIVKLMGDGALVEFGSVVEALNCALAIQAGMTGRNEDVPRDHRLLFRIGVHLGDVMAEDDDLYGDSVNVAARLEGLAEPGGICISQQVFDHVHTKLDLTYKDMGEQRVKNIARPIHTYRVGNAVQPKAGKDLRPTHRARIYAVAIIVLAVAGVGVGLWLQPWNSGIEPPAGRGDATLPDNRPSVAVLPFSNMSADPAQEYLADGMTEDLITDLAKISGLLVIARNSTFVYKGRSVDVREVADRLNVHFVVEGSVRKSGGRIRISAQLIDAETGTHVWAD